MQYTTHYNLNLPEGPDIVNPLVQDNPNYIAIDTALYNNKLRVIGNATHVKTGTNHAITLADSDIVAFKFVATGDYATGDTFTVDGVTVTARVADGSTIPNGAFKINSTVFCILDGSVLNLIGIDGAIDASDVAYNNTSSGLTATDVQSAIDEITPHGAKLLAASSSSGTHATKLNSLWSVYDALSNEEKMNAFVTDGNRVFNLAGLANGYFTYTRVYASSMDVGNVGLQYSTYYSTNGDQYYDLSNTSDTTVFSLYMR